MSEGQPVTPETQALVRITADAVLLDIEGTISPISFVRDTLFPYSRDRLEGFVSDNLTSPIVQDILAQAKALAGVSDAVSALLDWQARDVKAPPLKKLQGLIWESGYRSGALRSPIFSDALSAVKQWKSEGLPLYIYSSGSVQAQRLFFEFSDAGDLRPLFSQYFDTDVGPKTEPTSYLRIAELISTRPARIAYFSDNPKELEAARAADLQAVHVVKDETPHHPDFPEISDYCRVAVRR
ncbi:acireductone synthase [Hyphomicrobium sp. 99]|uniref:acireductone synthase n=1 Tax=Hyphomicrobium sp. 99 TaxID=1163419 RepID=UPI000697A6BA|nr:acireductone synthase [Hyphomicrobium sp. 99]